MSAQGAKNRRRGQNAERAVVNWLRQHGWPDARRYLSGDSRQPGDIDAIPGVCIEVKDVARTAWPSWCRQALAEANGRIPVVVRRERGVVDVGEWPAMILAARADDLDIEGQRVLLANPPAAWVHTTFAQIIAAVAE